MRRDTSKWSSPLQQASYRLAPGPRVVVALEHLELVALDEVFPGEENGRDLLLLYKAAEGLRVNAKQAGGLDEVKIVLERTGDHLAAILRRYIR